MGAKNTLLTITEAADQLRIAESTVRHWIASRKVPSVRVGGRRLLMQDDLDALVDQGRITADPRVALVRVPDLGPDRAGARVRRVFNSCKE